MKMLTEMTTYDMYINSIADRLKTDIVFQGYDTFNVDRFNKITKISTNICYSINDYLFIAKVGINTSNPIMEVNYLISQIYDSYKKVHESEEYYSKLQNIYGKDDIIKAFWVKFTQKALKVINDLVDKYQITEILKWL